MSLSGAVSSLPYCRCFLLARREDFSSEGDYAERHERQSPGDEENPSRNEDEDLSQIHG
jgi:hypothetical protein